MIKDPIGPATRYHELTAYRRGELSGRGLDWAARPSVYKNYPGRPVIPLPPPGGFPERGLRELIGGPPVSPAGLELAGLSRLLFLAYGQTAHSRPGGEVFHYRAAPSAGALYPAEIYLAACGLEGLPDGLYHYCPGRHALTGLLSGRLAEPGEMGQGVWFFLTAIFFRSAWKYQDRAWRYCLLDVGHLAENLLLAGRSEGLDMELEAEFDGQAVNAFLGLDPEREVCLAAGRAPGRGRIEFSALPPAGADLPLASRVSVRDRPRPVIGESLASGFSPTGSGISWADLGLVPSEWPVWPRPQAGPALDFARSVLNRRSRRNYLPRPLPAGVLGGLLAGLNPDAARPGLLTGLVLERAEGLADGFYGLDIPKGRLGLIRPGRFLSPLARASLDQGWLANAAALFVFLTDPARLEESFGSGGYARALLAAGRLGQGVYLAATSLSLGACGVGAFYDQEAAEALGLGGGGRMLYLVAVGPVKGGA